MTDYADPQWRFAARVKRLMDKHGSTKQETERIVKYVIETKEQSKEITNGTEGTTTRENNG